MRLISLALLVVLVTGTAGPARAEDGVASTASPGTRSLSWTDTQTQRVTLGAEGGIGLLTLPEADLGRAGVLRLGLTGDGFSARSFPVQGGIERFAGDRLSVSWVPLRFLETYANLAGRSSLSTRSTPPLIQRWGDVTVGVKAATHFGHGFFGGVDVNLRSYPGTLDLAHYAYGLTPRLLAGFDAHEVNRYVPLRLHVAAGARVDWNTLQTPPQLRAAEEFALDSNRYTRVLVGVGAEVPLPWVTAFAEYNLSLPVGIPSVGLLSPNGELLTSRQAMVETLSFGLKVTAVRDVTFLAAVQLGLNRNDAFGVPQAPPYNFFLGVSYHADLVPRPAPATLVVLAAPPPPRIPQPRWLHGQVVDASTHEPVGDALIHFTGTDLPPVASDAKTGRYQTYPLKGSHIPLRVTREGYAAAELIATLEEGENVADLPLTALPHKSFLEVHVTAEGIPVAAQGVLQTGDQTQPLPIPAEGVVSLELDPGAHSLSLTAPGYLSQTRELQMPDAGRISVTFELKPAPSKPSVQLKGNKLELKTAVHFPPGKARLLADSHALLQEIVDVLVKNRLALVRIEGHTDNKGSAKFNQKLSEERAHAVLEYLVAQGVDRSHLESQGFGGSRPVAPNLTPRGRELNRRVDFIVLKH